VKNKDRINHSISRANIPAFCLKDGRKQQKHLVNTVDKPVDIQTRHLPDTRHMRYQWGHLAQRILFLAPTRPATRHS